MSPEELCKYFKNSVETSRNVLINKKDSLAVLFSLDEVALDYDRKTMTFKDFGVVEFMPGFNLKEILKFEWVAFILNLKKEQPDISFGKGNPYDKSNPWNLPMKKGTILAIPAACSDDMPEPFAHNSNCTYCSPFTSSSPSSLH
jgi:hypothetical protein